MTNFLQDLRYGVRLAVQRPGFASIIVLTLALGIATSSLMFSGLYSFLLEPLPYKDPDRLVQVWSTNVERGWTRVRLSHPNYLDWKEGNQSLDDLAAYTPAGYNLRGVEAPERISGLRTTSNLFSLLGVEPALGRTFTAAEEASGDRVAVLGHALWMRSFGGEEILGRSIFLNGLSYTVVGVMAEEFWFPENEVSVWLPLSATPDEFPRDRRFLRVVGRLSPGSGPEQAEAELTAIASRLAEEYPAANKSFTGAQIGSYLLELFDEEMVLSIRLLFGAGIFVLLISCVNITNLLLSRGASRRREVALRAALGAGKLRIVRQLVSENVLLAALGAGLAVLLTAGAIQFIRPSIPREIARVESLGIDFTVVGFALIASLVTVVLFSVAPALELSRANLQNALAESGRRSSATAKGKKLQNSLVVLEIALTMIMLIGAGLLMKSSLQAQSVDPGFDPHDLLTVRLSLPQAEYPTENHVQEFFREMEARLEGLPFENTGVTNALPTAYFSFESIQIEGREPFSVERPQWANSPVVDPGYFKAMRIPLKRGRELNERDESGSKKVALINETMARRYWEHEEPLGARISLGRPGSRDAEWVAIVGIVGDVRSRGRHRPVLPEVYRPLAQVTVRNPYVVVRTSDPAQAASSIRAIISEIDPDLALYRVNTMEQVLTHWMWGERLTAQLMLACAAGGLLLTIVGLYGVISNAVAQRTQEIGIRLALGARAKDVLTMISRQGFRLTLVGLLLGLACSFGVAQLLTSLLHEVSPTDAATFIILPILMLGVSLAASYLPARRATSVDPSETLRRE